MKFILFFLLIIFSLSSHVEGQSDSVGLKVDAYIDAKMQEYNIPGIALAIISQGKVIKENYYGYSNLDHGVPVNPRTIFPIASIDKQFTATCIMMLYEQGKLNLSDPVSLHLDSVPGTWTNIQIKHLLSHTSGLPDEVPEYFKDRYLNNYTTTELFNNIKNQELLFPPGDDYLYSDAGFILLQLIVEKVSGMNFNEFLIRNILIPADMTSTFTVYPQKIIPNRTTSYFQRLDGENIVNTWRSIDFGPLYNDIGSTVADLAKYDMAISNCKLLKPATYEMMWTPMVMNDDKPLSNLVHGNNISWGDASYGYGWVLRKFRNHRIVYHSGYTGTSITRLPDDNLSVILFTNLTGPFNPDEMARHIAGMYIKESSPKQMTVQPDPAPSTSFLVHEQLKKWSQGTFDAILFTSEYAESLKSALPLYSRRMQNFGPLQKLEYLDSDFDGHTLPTVYYKATYAHGILYYQVRFTKDGKISFISSEK